MAFGARSRYLGHGYVITLCGVITYPCLRYLLLAPKTSFKLNKTPHSPPSPVNKLVYILWIVRRQCTAIKVAGNLTVCSTACPSTKENIKTPHYWPSVRQIHWLLMHHSHMYYSHQRTVIWKEFTYNDIMTVLKQGHAVPGTQHPPTSAVVWRLIHINCREYQTWKLCGNMLQPQTVYS